MREIKFRAWIGDRYEHSVVVGGGVGYFHNKGAECTTAYTPNPLIFIEEFIGLKDKNGVDIYEGDIVRISDELNSPIEFNEGGFWPTAYDCEYGWPDVDEVEVIGNVHQNPELT